VATEDISGFLIVACIEYPFAFQRATKLRQVPIASGRSLMSRRAAANQRSVWFELPTSLRIYCNSVKLRIWSLPSLASSG